MTAMRPDAHAELSRATPAPAGARSRWRGTWVYYAVNPGVLANLVAIGGSDAGISAALRARELSPDTEVTVVAADAYPNFSICGIPYYVSGEVAHWRNLAHRTTADLEAAGMRLSLDTPVRSVDPGGRKLLITSLGGREETLGYDKLIIGTGAVPVRPAPTRTGGSGVSSADIESILTELKSAVRMAA